MTEGSVVASQGGVVLRRVGRDDLGWMAEVSCDPMLVGEHNWAGEPRRRHEVEAELRERFDEDGIFGAESGTLVVELDDTRAGEVQWRTERWGPSVGSRCPAFGIALLPEFRGRGVGTVAQALLVDFLFRRDPSVHRVQTDTAADNPAEQRALVKIGMVEEGTVREAELRDGTHHDHVLYSVLRPEWEERLDRGSPRP